MSQHHKRARWSTASPKFRKKIEPLLPLPCVNVPCIRGGIVMREHRWEVGHRPGHEAHRGGTVTLADVGPAHYACQRREGGKLGAAKTNATRKARGASGGLRSWV